MTDPTDEEIMELMPQQMRDDLAAAARALAGSGRFRPPPEPYASSSTATP
jgi:hypothetical protein